MRWRAWRSRPGWQRPSRAAAPALPEEIIVELPEALTEALSRQARSHSLTLNTILQGAWAILLGRLTGHDDVVFGTTVAGRPSEIAGIQTMVGLFINTLPVRVRLRPAEPLSELLTRLQDSQSELIAHQHLGLAEIQSLAGLGDLFDTLVIFENYPLDRSALAQPVAGLALTSLEGHDATHYPLSLMAVPAERLRLRLQYRTDLFERSTVEAIGRRLVGLLEAVVADPSQPIGRIDILEPEERQQILIDWNNTACEVPHTTLPGLFEAQVERSPEAIALVFEESTLSYAELNAQANRLAHLLISRGVGPENLVAIALPRSIEMVVTLLGILKAGAAFLPLDPEYPMERLSYMLGDAQPACVLTSARISERLPEGVARLLLDHPEMAGALAQSPETNPSDAERTQLLSPHNPAYVIYTSGSTGTPKGVVVEHTSLANKVSTLGPYFGIGLDFRIAFLSPVAFDPSIEQITLPLTHGATIVVVSDAIRQSPAQFWDYVVQKGVNLLNCVPSFLTSIVHEAPSTVRLDHLYLGAEVFTSRLHREISAHLNIDRVTNGYGPTEATIDAVGCSVAAGADGNLQIPIGTPLPNYRVYVLDRSLQPVPVGVSGELYIAGAGLARGYLNRPALSAERFVADPFGPPGTRIYRTGDLARWRAEGVLDFLGRADQQLKLRGFRIEPGEIEAVLARHPSVAQAAVIAREDPRGDKRLVGYVVAQSGQSADPALLRSHVAQSLPEYMVPGAIVVLDALPLTPNGKLDRKALPAPEFWASASAAWRAPRTAQEEMLCALFAETLGVPRVGIDDNFFELGGHSLLATRLVSRVRATLELELPIRVLFEAPSVAELATRLREGQGARARLVRQPRPERLPLSYAQQRLWFIDQFEGTSTEYNMPEALRLQGELDQEALERTINTIVERHESLRTHFVEVDGEPVQTIVPSLRIAVPVEDLSALEEASQQQAVAAAMRREWEQPFDLARGPVLRIKLLRLGEHDHILLRTFHHIASDGWSVGVFNREFGTLYEAFQEGHQNPLEPLPVQYADFALWQRSWLDKQALDHGLEYWKEQLSGIPEQLRLPTDRPRPAYPTFAAELCGVTLPAQRLAGLKRLSQANNATLYMTLLSAFALLLERYSGQEDIVVGSPIANRQETQLEQLIGFFVNSLVMRVRVRPELSFRELLGAVRATTLDAYLHQDIPFERLVEDLSPERNLNSTPLFQVVFALQNAPAGPQLLKGLEITPLIGDELRVRFDLELHAFERGGQLELFWLYNRDLFERWRIEQMARHYLNLLEAAVAAPEVPLARLDMLGAQERHILVEGFNATAHAVAERTLPALFEAQVARAPEALAVIFGQESLSYGELNARANRLAHHLIGLGVGPESLVGIALERSTEMIVALLGTLKAGAAYLPLDPDYPQARLAHMLTDAAPALVLSSSALRTRLPGTVEVLSLDTAKTKALIEEAAPHNPTDAERTQPLNALNPAYVIYTSGSTGTPKGVVVTHSGIPSLVATQIEHFAVTSEARVLQFASLSFDAALWEVAMGLLSGAALVLPGAGERGGEPLAALIQSRGVTHATLPPVLLAGLTGKLPSLQSLVVAGETSSPDLVGRWSEGRRMVNAYGPTETTVCATISAPLSGAVAPPIGRPIWNTQAYVLDVGLMPVPLGVIGELYIAGAGLGRGYLNRPALSAERFVADPYGLEPGARMYRTGDLARWRSDGTLEFLGRADQQLKIRGFRIEPGEIEAALKSHERVQEALVTLHKQADHEQLLAYVIGRVDSAEQAQAQTSHIFHWQQLYESTYAQGSASSGDFNLLGWNSSYTGEPIPAEEMRLWVDETVAHLRALQPNRVLEIGCGTGLLLTRLAVGCESYLGLDLSAQVLAQLGAYLATREDLGHVVLRQGPAHELSFLGDDSVDLVILNSVVQYFPDIDYLLEVLSEAVRVTRRGGYIFVGDLRSLPLLGAYHSSVQLYKAPKQMLLGELQQRIAQAQRNEKELLVDPALFGELGRRWKKVGRVETSLKAGSYDNELSRFRYDVTMGLGEKEAVVAPERWLSWDEAGAWRQKLEEALALQPGLAVGVRGIRDRRVAGAVEAVRLLQTPGSGLSDAGQLQEACAGIYGEDPNEVMQLARRLGVMLCWRGLWCRGS